MEIDAARFQQIVATVFAADTGAAISATDAHAILALAELAVGADRREDGDERALLESLKREVCTLAGITPASLPASLGSLPTDDDDRALRMRGLAEQLRRTSSRELAYVVAFVLTIADLDIAPAEDVFIEELRGALAISEDRADELGGTVSELVTPPE